MKVAFATTDWEHVQGQLRRARRLVVYEVMADGWRLYRSCSFEDAAARSEHRIQALAGAAILYVAAIGPSTAARLAAHGIRAATAPEGTPIRDLLVGIARKLAPHRDAEPSCA